ncbi:MAG: TGS domain-containing protein, partial [Promethearchaeota archaeon]
SSKHFKALMSRYNNFPVYAFSVEKNKGIRKVAAGIFEGLGVIRIFTRKTSGEIGDRPLILPKGSTVEDLTKRLHSDFHKNFRYAIVFRLGQKMRRKKVGFTFSLEDQDVIQIFTN